MNTEHKQTYLWLIARVSRKTKLKPAQVRAVLNSISDLRWDWKNSKYDLSGIDIEQMLKNLGEDRCPVDLIDERLL